MVLPFQEMLEIERGEAADRGALVAEMVAAGGQRDLGAEVRGLHPEADQLVMLRDRPGHMVDEDELGLAGLLPRRHQADPERAGLRRALHRAVLRAQPRPILVGLDRAHRTEEHTSELQPLMRNSYD